MPSVSGRQHRFFEFIKHHPSARPPSLTAAQVDEWTKADTGAPWKRASGGQAGNGSEGFNLTPAELLARNKRWIKPGASSFVTPLSPADERSFQQWVKTNRVPFDPSDKTPDYDMRGFWKALQSGDAIAATAIDPNDKQMHFPDRWKTPYDLTFSRQSQYAAPTAPDWNDRDQLVGPSGDVLFDDRAHEYFPVTPQRVSGGFIPHLDGGGGAVPYGGDAGSPYAALDAGVATMPKQPQPAPRVVPPTRYPGGFPAALPDSEDTPGGSIPLQSIPAQSLPNFDDGGSVYPNAGATPPMYMGANPMVQQLYQRFANVPINRLQELAVMVPPNSFQGQMVRRALQAKQMAPASTGAYPAPQPPQPQPMPVADQNQPQQARGGGIPHLAGGGTSAISGAYGAQLPIMTLAGSGDLGMTGAAWSPSPGTGNVTTAAKSPVAAPAAPAGPTAAPGVPQSLATAYGNPWGIAPAATTPAVSQDQANQLWATMPAGTTAGQAQYTEQMAVGNPEVALAGMGYQNSAKRGGGIPHLAFGGLGVAPNPEQLGMFDIRRSMYGLEGNYHPGGFINSPVGGRTDHLPMAVAADSHVIPADVVSGLGEGNSLNGAALLDHVFHSGPWGMSAAPSRAPRTLPRPPRAPEPHAAGGRDKTTEILAAGGEYVVRPEAVAEMGRRAKAKNPRIRKSDIDAGHDAVDKFIVNARDHVTKTMAKLPGPVKS